MSTEEFEENEDDEFDDEFDDNDEIIEDEDY